MTELHPATIADFSEGLSVEETWRLLDHASVDRQAEVFAFFPFDKQVDMVSGVGRERMSKLLEAMSPDDRVDLLKRLDKEVVESLMPLVTKAERQDIRTLLSFPEGSAGSVMTTEYASLPADVAVRRRRLAVAPAGPVARDDLLHLRARRGASPAGFRLAARPDPCQAHGTSRRHHAAGRDLGSRRSRPGGGRPDLAKYDFLALPVVDDQHRLVGIITHDDVIDVMIEEATEDAQKMGGIVPMVEDYLEAPFFTVWRKRAAWLSCLFVAELFTFTALAHFEDEIAAVDCSEPVRPAVHLDRRQLGFASGHAHHPGAGPRAAYAP